jgi:hypothetical protein
MNNNFNMAPVSPVMFPTMPVGTTREELLNVLQYGGHPDAPGDEGGFWDTPDCGKKGAEIVIGHDAAVGLQKGVLTLAARLLPMSMLVPTETSPSAPVLEGAR